MCNHRLIVTFSMTIVLLVSPACLWDYDTIEMERQRFPETNELIVGKFLRHSPEFYLWRIRDRIDKIRLFPDSLSLYDDLAVAYSKLDFNKKAIEIIQQKEKRKPGLYETYANLGTFYIHDGQLENGLKYIEKSIEINPNAHFGREVYQKYLVEYVTMKKDRNKGVLKLPLSSQIPEPFFEEAEGYNRRNADRGNFYNFLKKTYKRSDSAYAAQEYANALNGIKGMMKFGNYDSPVLLEALGDLLIVDFEKSNLLAARAYLHAYYRTKQKLYRTKAEAAIAMQNGMTIKALELRFKAELKEGAEFFDQIRRDEAEWIKKGIDPEKAFAAKYYKDPVMGLKYKEFMEVDSAFKAAALSKEHQSTAKNEASRSNMGVLALLSVCGIVVLGFWGYLKYKHT